ncbi:uncharacterized protein METZ01_LOCUS360777 [marine metagenome]|uniref:Uncharacterized protein n=1 Tax=marine metagenome TaxID=408172 RepID=A0A382SDH2_9ZZZZ
MMEYTSLLESACFHCFCLLNLYEMRAGIGLGIGFLKSQLMDKEVVTYLISSVSSLKTALSVNMLEYQPVAQLSMIKKQE